MSKALRAYSRAINRWRDKTLRKGFEHAGHTWDSDSGSMLNLTEALTGVAAGVSLPSNFTWRSKDNVDVSADAQLLKGIAGAWRDRKQAIYRVSWQAKADLETQDPDQVLASLDSRLESELNA